MEALCWGDFINLVNFWGFYLVTAFKPPISSYENLGIKTHFYFFKYRTHGICKMGRQKKLNYVALNVDLKQRKTHSIEIWTLTLKAVHEGKRPYKCSECDADFAYKQHMKTHIISVHEKRKPHLCPTCGVGFADKSNLINHISAVHEGKKRQMKNKKIL